MYSVKGVGWVITDNEHMLVEIMQTSRFQNNLDFSNVYYVDDKGLLAKGWRMINQNDYYFDENYRAVSKGWIQDGTDWYLFDYYTVYRNRWIASSNGRWYYLGDDGKMVTDRFVDGCYINSLGIYWGIEAKKE